MLFCFGLFALLLYNTVVANADCSFTFSKSSGEIRAFSMDLEDNGYSSCLYHIQAPKQYNIQINFTHIFGFVLPLSATNSTHNSCLPEVEIKDIMTDGQEVETNRVCWEKNNSLSPQVFLSHSNTLKLIYNWKLGHRSGFHIYYHTVNRKNCESGSTSECQVQERSSPTGSSNSVNIIVIVVCTAIFISLGVVICLVMRTQCPVVSRAWHRQISRDRPLRPPSPSSEVFVSTPSSREQMEQQEALLRDRFIQISSTQRDSELGYPPQIPISRDGEEGYAESQKQLANQRNLDNTDSQQYFRPPPNRTIFDRKQSPPPYSYNSASSLDTTMSCGKPSNGYSSVIRCHSVSINSAKSDSASTRSNLHSRTSSFSVPIPSPIRLSQHGSSQSSVRIYTGTGGATPPSPPGLSSSENVYNNNKQVDV